MIDREFCDFLEYEMCRFFSNSDIADVKGFWCDGVLLSAPEICYSQEFIAENRRVSFKAFIGKDEQAQYDLVLRLGNDTLGRFIENPDLQDYLSIPDKKDSFSIDLVKKEIEIQLD